MSPLEEDFARWREDPMTRRFLAAIAAWEDRVIFDWQLSSLNGTFGRPEKLFEALQETQAQVRCLSRVRHMEWPDVAKWLELDDAE